MSEKFKKPDVEQDSKFIQDEESRSGGSGEALHENQYKPKPSYKGKPQVINRARVLAARGDSEGTYYLRIGRHFIKHDDRTEMFYCPKEITGDPCPSCEAYLDLKAKDDKSADKYKPQIRGVMNVLNRDIDPSDAKVQLYFSPIQAICTKVVNLVRSEAAMSDIFDELDDKFKSVKPGRDMVIIYNKNADPGDMYMTYPTDVSLLGTPEQVEEWYSQIRDLTPKGLFGKLITYEDAFIKTFGSADEREALRARWSLESKQRQEAQQAEEKPKEEEKPKAEEKKAEEPAPAPAKEEPKVEEPKVDPKDKLKIGEKSAAEDEIKAKLEKKLAAIKAAQQAAKK